MSVYDDHYDILVALRATLAETAKILPRRISEGEVTKIIEETITTALGAVRRGFFKKNLIASNGYKVQFFNSARKNRCVALCNPDERRFAFVIGEVAREIRSAADSLGYYRQDIPEGMIRAYALQIAMHEFRHSHAVNTKLEQHYVHGVEHSWADWQGSPIELDANEYALAMVYDWLEEQS